MDYFLLAVLVAFLTSIVLMMFRVGGESYCDRCGCSLGKGVNRVCLDVCMLESAHRIAKLESDRHWLEQEIKRRKQKIKRQKVKVR